MTETTDSQLLVQISQGDRDAFTLFLDRHLTSLRQYLFTLTASWDTAEDLAQETFLALWLKASSYNENLAQPNTWLYRIAHNLFVDAVRKPATRVEDLTNQYDESVESDSFDAKQALAWVQSQLQQLPVNQRSAISLKYFRGYSNRQCATVLGVSESAIDALLGRAKKTLQRKINAQTQAATNPTIHALDEVSTDLSSDLSTDASTTGSPIHEK